VAATGTTSRCDARARHTEPGAPPDPFSVAQEASYLSRVRTAARLDGAADAAVAVCGGGGGLAARLVLAYIELRRAIHLNQRHTNKRGVTTDRTVVSALLGARTFPEWATISESANERGTMKPAGRKTLADFGTVGRPSQLNHLLIANPSLTNVPVA